MKNLPSTPEERRQLRAAGSAMGLGCSIVTSIILFLGGGIALDRWRDTSPIFTLIGLTIGLIIAGYQMYELAMLGHKDRSPKTGTKKPNEFRSTDRK